jgi:ribosome-associated translation inhibitor RaiA
MTFTGENHPLRVQIDTHQSQLPAAELGRIRDEVAAALGRQLQHFPYSDVRVLVAHSGRSNDYSVKTTLILSGTTLVGNDHDPVLHAALERCLAGLCENIRAYKDRLGQVPERQKQQKGTHQDLHPDLDPDPAALDAAVAAEDYTAYRTAVYGFEEPLRKRVGRRVERYPQVVGQIGKGLTLADIVEGVLLRAFAGHATRPAGVRFGDWLEALTDETIRALQAHRDEELERINLARSAVEAENGRGSV